jgi:oligogalacturonide lyase
VLEIDPPGSATNNLYYHFSNFTADDREVIFSSTVGGEAQIFAYEVAGRRTRQLTKGPGVGGGSASPHVKDASLLYYLRGAVVEELNLASGAVRRVGVMPEPRVGGGGQPTMSHDLKSLALVKQRDAANWEIGLMDIGTGGWRTVTTVGFRVGHVQHHPKLPLIFYVWETGGYAPQRTWVVNADGTANRPFYYTTDPKEWVTPLKEWVTHESWVPETGQMTMIMDKVGIVIADVSGKGRLLPGQYWHVRAREDGRFLLADDFNGNLWLIEAATDNRRLLASGLRDGVRAVHAHASFDRTGRHVFFNTGRTRQTVALIDLQQAGIYSKPWCVLKDALF